ncbi:dihydroorotase [Reichenbachiella carrageenanivorans]|uniref:Dihydroorotase n=1 Tax=Reichenbachiella carrageenanivorans TaxID=2979869 RepID=A0ABY6D0F0_9BACT|nr:dihydroorotase [Reichenbachiella carrageenanivorans]UXX79649.1 dihydroorotase [Reichenbachiella carrageenanivorans]
MNIFLRDAKILDPHSPHHNKVVNIHIKDGLIVAIDKNEHPADTIIEAKGMLISTGWFDMKAHFNDPGTEHKEDLSSGAAAAAFGGFTGVAIMPNTEPVIQTKGSVEYVRSKSNTFLTDIYPMAAVTLDTKGEDLTEMLDLHEAGAIAFTDGDKPIWHTDMMLKSLIYLQKIDGLLINQPEDQLLTRFGSMNEGAVSTVLGLKGMPTLAEHLMIKRDLDLLKYAGGKIHFSNISTKESVSLIKKAKKKGLQVSCDVSIHHLMHIDEDLMGYDSNYKINPPLRTDKDRRALIKGLKEDVIDAIVSAHTPQDEESKKLEFDRAEFGIAGLQTMLPTLLQLGKELDPSTWIEKLTTSPRMILKLPTSTVAKNQVANLTLFDPKAKWTLNDQSNQSKSRNSPYFNQSLTGKVKAIFNNLKFQIFE